MAFKTPDQIATAAANAGIAKANLSPGPHVRRARILAGAYIGFAGLLGIAVTSGLSPDTWGTLPSLIFGLRLLDGPDPGRHRRLRAAHRQHGAASAGGQPAAEAAGPQPS